MAEEVRIPRLGRSSPHPHEYIVEVSPAYGEPTTITLTARSDKQAIEKAKEKARLPIPATAKILSKVELESSSNPRAQREEERLAAIDLIMKTLLDHEKKLDALIDELEHIVLALNDLLEKIEKNWGLSDGRGDHA